MLSWERRMVQARESSAEEGDLLLQVGSPRGLRDRGLSTLKAAAIVAAPLLLVAGFLLSRSGPAEESQGVLSGDALEFTALRCHTTKPGERCFKDIHWAKAEGIHGHPQWYKDDCPKLHASSDMEDFQKCVHKLNPKSCPHLPCKAAKVQALPQVPVVHHHHQPPVPVVSVQLPMAHKVASPPGRCHTARHGEPCHKLIMEAAAGALRVPGVTRASSIEDVQEALHLSGKHCPRPCRCEAAKPGSQCYKHVNWALNGGLKKHPFWYKGLADESTFEEVQAYLHTKNSCPNPCQKLTAAVVPHGKHQSPPEACHLAQQGEECYTNVLYGMRRGLFEHPGWYPGLDVYSSFEDFQKLLYRNPDLKCPKPCSCKTAKIGDECFKHVQWVLHEGMKQHPNWYPSLNSSSRFEDIQADLAVKDPKSKCEKPCTQKVWGTPSLFCFSIFRSTGYELALVKSQIQKGVGIFNCDEFAILSDKKLVLSSAIEMLLIPSSVEHTGVSKDGTAANTEIFVKAWNVIAKDLRYKAHDWVIKADPDAVLIVPRMRSHLAPHNGKNVFMQNCMKYEGPSWPTMFGSLEAFSHKAIETYFKGVDKCKRDLKWSSWGEDLFMNNCLKHLGVEPAFDGKLIGDNVCKGADCKDGVSASYHPFKSPEEWFQCYSQATGATHALKK